MPDAMDLSHLDALRLRLAHECARLVNSRNAKEREIRTVWVAGIEREIADEYRRLGISTDVTLPEMTDDELLAALES